jgi:hypothetical protein
MVKKIAFWRTVGDSFNFVFGDWHRFFRLGAVWIGLSCLLFVVILVLFGPDALKPATATGKVQSFNLGNSVAALPFLVLAIVSYIAFSVAWHRAVLLGETTSEPLRALRFRWREWRFLLYLIVVTALSMGVFLAALLGTGGIAILVVAGGHALSDIGGWALAVAIIAMVVVFIAIMPFLARFSLGLPAIAVEEPEGVFGRSWHRARHNGWRLIWGPFVCSIPFSIVSGIFSGIQQGMYFVINLGEPWHAIALLVMLVFYGLATVTHFLALAGAITFLSLSYRQLVGDETPSAPALQASAE